MEYLIKQYSLDQGSLEIEYIEECFNEFPRRKTAGEIVARLAGREHQILMAEAALPDDPGGARVPVSYKIGHELRARETDLKLADLVARLRGCVRFVDRKVLYQWIGATRSDWRGQGHFRALTEEQEAWAVAAGFDEIIVKTKNRFHEMRSTLAHLQYHVILYDRHPFDNAESKVYLSKLLSERVLDAHRSQRSLTFVR